MTNWFALKINSLLAALVSNFMHLWKKLHIIEKEFFIILFHTWNVFHDEAIQAAE